MAPKRLDKQLDGQLLDWLFKFAYGDIRLNTPADRDFWHARFSQLLSAGYGHGGYGFQFDAREAEFVRFSGSNSADGMHVWSPRTSSIERMREELHAGLEALRLGKTWAVHGVRSTHDVLNGGSPQAPPSRDSRLVRRYEGKPQRVFIAAASDLLTRSWSLFRWCADPTCGRPFVPTGRQDYHTTGCSQRVRTRRMHDNPDK